MHDLGCGRFQSEGPSPLPLFDLLANHRVVLAEGAVLERLRRDPAVTLDPFLLHASLVLDPVLRHPLEAIYRQYLEISLRSCLPILIFTPTWRANPERCQNAHHSCKDLNITAVQFLKELRENYGTWGQQVQIGGLIGCRGDAYRPEEALETEVARHWHTPQTEALALAGADFLFGATLPAASEALGIARCMAAMGKPYIISFIIRPDGCLLDETPLENIILRIDETVSPAPIVYTVNCVHHTNFRKAMEALRCRGVQSSRRITGLQANTSAKSPAELEGSSNLDGEDPRRFAEGMIQLYREYSLKILGGCCGSDDRHILEIAKLLTGSNELHQTSLR
jgi:homocysteine S-methyltransferase